MVQEDIFVQLLTTFLFNRFTQFGIFSVENSLKLRLDYLAASITWPFPADDWILNALGGGEQPYLYLSFWRNFSSVFCKCLLSLFVNIDWHVFMSHPSVIMLYTTWFEWPVSSTICLIFTSLTFSWMATIVIAPPAYSFCKIHLNWWHNLLIAAYDTGNSPKLSTRSCLIRPCVICFNLKY